MILMKFVLSSTRWRECIPTRTTLTPLGRGMSEIRMDQS